MADEKYRGGGSDPLSKRILNSIKPFSGEQTSKWLAALSTDTAKDAVVIKNDSDPTQEPPRSMAAWVDGLFDHFQRYAYDFSSMCTDPELQVNCTRPILQEPKSLLPGQAQDTSIVSLGYLSTYQWALVVRGEFFRIGVYIVPVGVLMGFKARHDEFPVYMEMLAAQTARNKINWTLDGQPVSMDQASAIAKRLFAHLIMVARGEASDKDKFSLNQKTPPGQSSVQHDSSLPARPKSFGTSDSKVELLKPEWLLDENPAPQSQHLQSQSQSGHPLQQSSSGQQFGQPPFRQSQENQSQTGPQQFFANQSASGNSQGSSAASGYPAPHISPVNAPNVSPQNQMKSQMQAASQMQGNVQDLLQQNLVLVLNECNQFAGALDQQLELLTPIGVKSIQNQDMETASEVMQRAKRLKALLDAVVTFTNEWKTSSK